MNTTTSTVESRLHADTSTLESTLAASSRSLVVGKRSWWAGRDLSDWLFAAIVLLGAAFAFTAIKARWMSTRKASCSAPPRQ